MAFYIDIGVVRIQEYLLRTAGAQEGQLRKRRGASQMVSEATAADAFGEFKFRLNTETYATEGVAHLISQDEPTNESEAAAIAEKCLVVMRRALPQAYLSASWAVADDYDTAEGHVKALLRFAGPDAIVGTCEWAPAVREEATGEPCKGCGRSPRRAGGNCADCALRDVAGSRLMNRIAPDDPAPRAASPEVRAITRMVWRRGESLRVATDLSELARLNPWPKDKENQLATIYTDANNVGVTFRSLQSHKERRELSKHLTEAIEASADEALDLIAASMSPGEDCVFPASVTVLAADDVVITVPASLGWLFVDTLIRTFDDKVDAVAGDESGRQLSLSAGIVFSNKNWPIENTIGVAGDVLKDAKKATGGGQSSIGWHDLTQHGVAAVERSRPRGWFEKHRAFIDEISTWPRHQWNKWVRDLASDTPEPHRLLGYLQDEARRLGLKGQLTPLHDHGAPEAAIADLIDIFDISRWWHSDNMQGRQK